MSSVNLPPLAIGTWRLGHSHETEKEAIRLAIDKGINFIDTAEIYHTEKLVGEAIKGHDNVFVATKVSPANFHHDDVLKACDRSLANLGVKAIDLYQLHWPNNRVPIRETMLAMEDLVDKGKVKHIGVSNFSIEELQEAQEAMRLQSIVSNQIEMSVLVRDAENGMLEYCKENNILVLAYSPFSEGLLFKKYPKTLKLLEGIGKRYNKTAAQVALNWLLMHDNVIPIVQMGRKEHVLENLGALDFKLNEDDMTLIGSNPEKRRSNEQRWGWLTKNTSFWASLMGRSYGKKDR
ncbi:MAG: aldo/keto reductase [Candidatus Micrarchaeota archaeon]|nr:aldo/keto reductase [Candidatus Micrarchaeota archaeon]